jgi:hypothetical protein
MSHGIFPNMNKRNHNCSIPKRFPCISLGIWRYLVSTSKGANIRSSTVSWAVLDSIVYQSCIIVYTILLYHYWYIIGIWGPGTVSWAVSRHFGLYLYHIVLYHIRAASHDTPCVSHCYLLLAIRLELHHTIYIIHHVYLTLISCLLFFWSCLIWCMLYIILLHPSCYTVAIFCLFYFRLCLLALV